MERIALAFPVLPGKDAREISAQFYARPAEYEASRSRLGMTMERAYLQQTPMGDFVCAYWELEGNVPEMTMKLAQSELALDQEFVTYIKEIHGTDLTEPPSGPPPETVGQWADHAATVRKPGLAFCAPLQAEAGDRFRAFAKEAFGHADYAASRRAVGLTQELVTLIPTPQGDIICVYLEGDDPIESDRKLTASTSDFDKWFHAQLATLVPPFVDLSKPVGEGISEVFDSTRIVALV